MSDLKYGTILLTGTDGQRQGGKIFTKWKFINRLSATKAHYEVEVEYHNKNDELFFIAHNKELLISMQNSDINALKKDVSQYMTELTEAKEGMVWENWLEIVILKSTPIPLRTYHPETNIIDNTISFKVNLIKKGKNPLIPNKEFTIYTNGALVEFPKSKEFSDGPEEVNGFLREEPQLKAYLLDTEENRNALNRINDGINNINDQLNEILNQKNIDHYLMKITNNTLKIK